MLTIRKPGGVRKWKSLTGHNKCIPSLHRHQNLRTACPPEQSLFLQYLDYFNACCWLRKEGSLDLPQECRWYRVDCMRGDCSEENSGHPILYYVCSRGYENGLLDLL
jgi:hypothetical protein